MKESSRTKSELLAEISILKQKNNELQENEEYARSLFTNAYVPIIIMDAETGIYTDCNAAAVRIYGYNTREEVLGKTPLDVSAPLQYDGLDSAIEAQKHIKIVREKGSHIFEWRHQRPNGQIWDAYVHLMLLQHRGKSLIQFMLQDITGRKLAEEAQQKSIDLLKSIFDSFTEVVIFALDRQYRYIAFNKNHQQTMKQIWGVDITLGNSMLEYIKNNEDRIKAKNNFDRALSGESFKLPEAYGDMALERRYYEDIYNPLMDEDGHIIGLTLVLTDITESKRAEEALKESEQKLTNIIDFLPDATFVIDRDEKVVIWNRAMEEMTGIKKEDMIGQGNYLGSVPFYGERRPYFLELVDADDKELESKYKYVQKKGNTLYAEGFAQALYGGKGAYIWAMGTPLFDGRGNRIGAIESIRDITDRKLTEGELVWKTAFLEAQVEATIDGILVVDGKGQKILANQHLLDIWKVPEHIRNDQDVTSLLQYVMSITKYPEQFLEKVMYLYEHPNEISRDEIEFKDGMILDRYSSPVLGKDGKYYGRIWAFRDITARKRTEEALHQSEAILHSVFKATPVGLCIMKNRVYQNINDTYFENLGYSESEIIGYTPKLLYENEEEYERVGRELYTSLSERGCVSIQTKHLRKNGDIRDVIMTAVPLQGEDISPGMTVVTVEDITDHKRAIEELEENRRQMADIIEFLPDATLIIDKEGKVITWNQAIEVMTGVKKENMLGKGNQEYALPFYGDRRKILIDLALHPDREIEKKYTAIQRRGDILLGESFTPNLPPGNVHLSGTASVLRDNNGEITAAIECIRDNTERKRLEDRLNRAEKMEALRTLAGGVAHDLNNVLGALVGYSELLRDKLPEDSTLREYADNIVQSGLRGAAIINDLLTLARRGVNISGVVNLNKLVFSYLRTPEFEELKSHHPDVKIWTDLEDKLLNIKGSPIHLNKTIMNLVSNAVEAIPGAGEVTIKTENCYLDCPVRGYDEMQEGDYVVLKVCDTGTGISSDDIKKIFEPFYTKKVMGRSGTGLGLAVVWGTVKDHHGYIDIQSEEGKGSTFVLYIPVTRDDLVKVEKVISPVAYMGRNESILVVDDVKEQRELAVNMLGKLGYQVEAVSSGEAAIEYLKNKKADLIILDMLMDPGIDGTETYRRLLEINPGQRAILVSGFSENDRVMKAQEMGAGAFVQKPYILENIGFAVRKELDRR